MPVITLDMQIKPFILLILITSLISLSIIYSKTNESIGNKREIRAFKGMLISFMVYTLVDLRLMIGDKFYTDLPRLFVILVMAAGFCSMSFSCYFWYLHVLASSRLKIKPIKIKSFDVGKILMLIPLSVDIILFITPLHNLVYYIEDTVYFSPMMLLVLLMDYIYLMSATVISIISVVKTKSKLEKKKFRSQIIFIIAYTLSGILIGFLLNLPAIEICVNPVVLKLFVELQDSQIYTDALTKLNNRRRMSELITDEIATSSEENPLTVIMIDMDFFKYINDLLGHDEGDHALITFSHCIRKVIRNKDAFASRWGGDEFVVAGKDPDIARTFRNDLEEALSDRNDIDYVLSFSTGIAKCTSPSMTYEEVLSEADSALYADKEVQHLKASEFINKLKSLKSDN
ncbi:MAG: GGDEF domain-containing protein [Butyrivibrio sp.]|nr:GGDEF domain-containing protein [Butyrivibrio sp.]